MELTNYRWIWVIAWFLCIPSLTQAQDLVRQYSEARLQVRATELMQVLGQRAVPRQVEYLPSVSDTISAWIIRHRRFEEELEPLADEGRVIRLGVLEWRKVEPDERRWFLNRFREAIWTQEGSRGITMLDTTSTRVVRSKLEAVFGSPSNTIVEIANERRPRGGEYIQFEYWFVLNDSIPVIVMDVDGPFDRGVIFAGDLANIDMMPEARRSLVSQISQIADLAPYVDYYYSVDRGVWYKTGYDGDHFFVERMSQPNLTGGRPRLSDR